MTTKPALHTGYWKKYFCLERNLKEFMKKLRIHKNSTAINQKMYDESPQNNKMTVSMYII